MKHDRQINTDELIFFNFKITDDKWDLIWGDRPDDGGSELLWNVGNFLPDYTAQHPSKQ
jgi:hypothetical protein